MGYKKLAVLISILFLVVGCAPRKEVVIVNQPQNQTQQPEISPVDTLSQDTTSAIIVPDTTEQAQVPDTTPEVQSSSQSEGNKVMGYRVQIFAFSTRDRAERAKVEAEKVLSLPVYIQYDPTTEGPYKVRVGDFTTREEAERYKEKLRQEGYPDAFVVETEINTGD